jgi:hypothetical protein
MKKLNEIAEKKSFKVPENYFEEVNKKIISATAGYDQKVEKTGLYHLLRPYLLIAASVTGFIILSYTAVKLLTPDRTASKISEVIYNEYAESIMNDIDIITLEENATSLLPAEEGPDVNKSDIIDYLLFENIEINDIYEQL